MYKIIMLIVVASFCYSAETRFVSFPELVEYVNKLSLTDLKGYCADDDVASIRDMIKSAKFDSASVRPDSVGEDRQYGMCDITKGIHVVIHFSISEDKTYVLKEINRCR